MPESIEVPRRGKRVTFNDDSCFVCGNANPIGLKLKFSYDIEKLESKSSVTFESCHQGWDNVVHGGILACVMDDAMAHALFTTGNLAVTTHMNLTYRKAVKVGEKLHLEGKVISVRNRVGDVSAVGYVVDNTSGEKIIKVESTGTYFLDPKVDN